jgi:hypothetical protein
MNKIDIEEFAKSIDEEIEKQMIAKKRYSQTVKIVDAKSTCMSMLLIREYTREMRGLTNVIEARLDRDFADCKNEDNFVVEEFEDSFIKTLIWMNGCVENIREELNYIRNQKWLAEE